MSRPARELFGTDGIRGRAGVFPLVPETVVRLGQAAAEIFLSRDSSSGNWPTVVIGKDTRQSGDMLENAIAAGLNSRGIDVQLAGVVPTPAVAFLTKTTGARFGIVISASHNPFRDNGIKFFGPDGYKLDDDLELEIEQRLLDDKHSGPENPAAMGRCAKLERSAEDYISFVRESVGNDSHLLSGMKIALDNSNGASFRTSEAILRSLGAEVISYHDHPNGININEDCGCTHADVIAALVKETGAHVGVSHDGDADRVLLADETGSALDGDEMMAMAAVDMIEKGILKDNTLVATVMSNAGLIEAVAKAGGKVVRTGVGDRYVIEEMRKHGYNLGGEQSGHFIFHDHITTGDGIISAVQLLRIIKEKNQPLSELRKVMTKFPQAQRNVRVTKKMPVDEIAGASDILKDTESQLGNEGRVLLRYSGTEPLLRILIEGRDGDYINAKADEIANAVTDAIGE